MLGKRVAATFGVLACLTASAWAGTIQDPAAWIDQGSGSTAISTLGNFSPCGEIVNGQCTGILNLFNDTGARIISVKLTTEIDPNLTYQVVDADTISLNGIDFNCDNESLGNPFFKECGFAYYGNYIDPTSRDTVGLLRILFYGVDPSLVPVSGARVGIPPVPANCLPDPDTQCPASSVGHFELNFLGLADFNGWTNGSADSIFLGGTTPTFGPPTYAEVGAPEPGTSTLLAAGMLLLILLSRRSYFSRKIRS
jgi:hypothetical protein